MATFTVHENPPPSVLDPVAEGLRRFNENCVGASESLVLAISASDAAGAVIGGVKGILRWGWVYVEQLWVDGAHRGRGIGGELLQRLETEALKRGAQKAALLTASWQAPEFYLNRGYTTIATFDLQIHPSSKTEHADYLLVKALL